MADRDRWRSGVSDDPPLSRLGSIASRWRSCASDRAPTRRAASSIASGNPSSRATIDGRRPARSPRSGRRRDRRPRHVRRRGRPPGFAASVTRIDGRLGSGRRQRLDRQEMLGPHPQGRPTRRQDLQVAPGARGDRRRLRPPPSTCSRLSRTNRVGPGRTIATSWPSARLMAGAGSLQPCGDRSQQVGPLPRLDQIDEDDAIVDRGQRACRADREGGLADAAGPGQRDQPHVGGDQQGQRGRTLPSPADERRGRGRQRRAKGRGWPVRTDEPRRTTTGTTGSRTSWRDVPFSNSMLKRSRRMSPSVVRRSAPPGEGDGWATEPAVRDVDRSPCPNAPGRGCVSPAGIESAAAPVGQPGTGR